MQRLLAFFYSRFLFTRFEPSIWSWQLQSDIERICSRLHAARLILLSIMSALTPSHHCNNLTWMIAEEAVKITSRISKVVETAEESPQLSQNISQLKEILFAVQIFIQSKSQSKFALYEEDAFCYPSSLTARLTAILETFERNTLKPSQSEDKAMMQKSNDSDVVTNQILAPTRRSSLERDCSAIEANLNRAKNFSDSASLFASARISTINGGTYLNVLGNYNAAPETKYTEQSRTPQGIVPGSRVFTEEDVSWGSEIYKGHGYRLYTAQSSGKVVAVKVYEGDHARERCMEAAKFNRKMIHPNIPHMIAVSSVVSEHNFLVFNGEYDGTLEYTLSQVLKQGLEQSLAWGLQTVIGLSSALGYLQDQNYPFSLVPTLDHFVIMTCREKIILSFEPGYPRQTSLQDQRFSGALDIFNGLCQKTFDAACQAHYKSRQIERAFINDFEAEDEEDSSEEDLPQVKAEEAENREELPRRTESKGTDQPEVVTYQSPLQATESKPPLPPKTSSRKKLPSGRRQELVWKPSSATTITLNEISRDFQYFVNATSSNSEPTLSRRRGRPTARTAHRCPGYNRIEITLTPDIERSVIVSHASPTPYEICPVCKEVVQDAEIFNCSCGGIDDESMPTIRCSKCLDWHHWRCAGYPDLNSDNFVCGRCNVSSKVSDFEAEEEPSEEDLPQVKAEDAENREELPRRTESKAMNHPNMVTSQSTPQSPLQAIESKPPPAPKSSSRKKLPSGRRQELIWKPSSAATITPNELSRDFKYFVNATSSNSEPTLSRRRGRSTARTAHRCPGYNRITLTSDIERSVVLSHASPGTPYEICPVCQEVVKDAEIFNCICGGIDDESMPIIRCSKCLDWHHWRCADYPDLGSNNFVCGRCKRFALNKSSFNKVNIHNPLTLYSAVSIPTTFTMSRPVGFASPKAVYAPLSRYSLRSPFSSERSLTSVSSDIRIPPFKEVSIHYLLAFTPYTDPVLSYDLSKPPYVSQGSNGSSQPATSPPLPRLIIIHPLFMWTVEVLPLPWNPGYVTVNDVLSTLYQELHMAVDPAHYAHLPTEERRCVDHAYFNRCSGIRDVIKRKYVEKTGIIKLDFLTGRTRFNGLSSTTTGPDIWGLNVS